MKKRYCVGGHYFTVEARQELMREGYEPFRAEEDGVRPDTFWLGVNIGGLCDKLFVVEMRQEDEGQVIEAGHIEERPAFRFGFCGRMTGIMVFSEDYREAVLNIEASEHATLDNALMVLYALATADKMTLLMHASVTVNDGRGYLFIAPSGTGKSTHSSLWLQHINGSWLLNDDNPVVRLADGQATVFGSPWSGKTPCYKNEQVPVGAVVRIAQAPKNEICRLTGIKAYAELMASASGMRWDRRLADGLHETLNALAMNVPVYHLDCLPDEAAAKLCFQCITNR